MRETCGMAEGQPDFWRALGLLRLDRQAGLTELDKLLRAGSVPPLPDGEFTIRLVALTVGYGLDPLLEALAGWLFPWQGLRFSASTGRGHTIAKAGAVGLLRLFAPHHPSIDEGPGRVGIAPFTATIGPSLLVPGREVLRLDYRSAPENRLWPFRDLVDEVVDIGERLLGQALVTSRGRIRRIGWFTLQQRAAG